MKYEYSVVVNFCRVREKHRNLWEMVRFTHPTENCKLKTVNCETENCELTCGKLFFVYS